MVQARDYHGHVSPLPRTTAQLRVEPSTGRLRDEHRRDIIMRGVNAGGRSKWAPFMPFPFDEGGPRDFARSLEDYLSPLASWGLDTLRLTFSWEALEPRRGHYDMAYLDRYEEMINAAWARNIGVVVDFHQDIYAGAFSGDGFPAWTLEQDFGPSRHDDPMWFFRYVRDARVQRAFDRFWADADGIQTDFVAMWRTMARRLGGHPGVVGFEIINEPGWGSTMDLEGWKRKVLAPFYTRLGHAIQAEAPGKLVLYDDPGIDALMPKPVHVRPEALEGLVFAPHLYDPGLITSNPWTGSAPEGPLERLSEFRLRAGVGVFLGEFGVGHGAQGAEEWLQRTLDAIDVHRFSATLWEYSLTEERWNGEDLSVVEADGSERPILDTFVRPWLRALAGHDPVFDWDGGAGRVEAWWISDGGVSELIIPSRRFPEGPQGLKVRGRGARATWDPARSQLRVTAEAGSSVELIFED